MSASQHASRRLLDAAARLRDAVNALSFASPVTHVYNPLDYAWESHRLYLKKVPNDGVRVLMLGMNPGPWGMGQTGVPFGEVAAVRDWLGIEVPVKHPDPEHPKRPVEGFQCARSEVSGRRLWGLFRDKLGTPDRFFADYFIANYCPLVFMEESGRNRTPDKLPAGERQFLNDICDQHLMEVIETVDPEHLVAVGTYAEGCLKRVVTNTDCQAKLTRILHPSPASPAANKDWSGKVTAQLLKAEIW